MGNGFLYTLIIFTWGTSWLAIKYQLGEVHPQMSVAYRFILAGVLLVSYCLLRRKSLAFTFKQHLRIAFQAIFLFSTNYILIYRSSAYMASGLESIVFSVLIFMNIMNSRIFLRQALAKEVLLAAVIGFMGILLVFNKEVTNFSGSTDVLYGVGLGVLAAYFASLGNIVSASNQKVGLHVLQTTALGMLYGGVWTLLLSLAMGIPVTFSSAPSYWVALVFLAVFASIFAFLSYLTLLGRIGPSRAGYCVLIFPLIAVVLSIFFEGYLLDPLAAGGMALILFGNYIVMFRPKLLSR